MPLDAPSLVPRPCSGARHGTAARALYFRMRDSSRAAEAEAGQDTASPTSTYRMGDENLRFVNVLSGKDTKPFSGASCKHLTNATSFILVCFCSWQHPWPQPGQWRVRAPSPRRFPASLPTLRCLVLFASQGDPNPT